ncbi:UNVERIFIED_CONTAM: hypothetical protein RF653_05185 [Kocuria sp. CPCC 205316]|uniref:hypothetical protein n=1 Tax=Kocuria TaxID=57493 RepID=UPI0036D78483
MTADGSLRVAGTSLLFAGFLCIVRWWVATRGEDRSSRDRRIAVVLIGASLVVTVVEVVLRRGTG